MITVPVRAPSRERPAGLPTWRVIAGLGAAAGGAAMVAGALLPWVEAFAGLIAIPGVRGSYGRILAAAGAVIAAAGIYHLVRGGRWPRLLAGFAGFAGAGFAGYLLIQLSATMRALGSGSMVLARGGPGLWVTFAGALAAFGTLFLPLSPAAEGAPGSRWQAALAGQAVRLHRLALRRTADTESAGGRRGLQIALGVLWLADAALQLQPFMFGRGLVTQVLMPAAVGNPAVIADPQRWAGGLIAHGVPAWNTAFALIQLGIGLGLLWRPAVRAALAASVAWALAVWWLGEGLGGLLTGTASPVTGAPGAVILYALLAVVAWPQRSPVPAPGSIAAASPLGRSATAVWVLLWSGLAYLILQPAVRAPYSLASALHAQAAGEPGWLATADRWAASAAAGHGLAISAVLAGVFVLAAAGILHPATARPALVLAASAALAIWVVGENFGMILAGGATDPNTGPLLALLAVAYWPSHGAAADSTPVMQDQLRPQDRVQQLLYSKPMSVGFRPTEEDLRVIEANRRENEKTSDVIRRALRLLDREAWEERARADMHRLRSEGLSTEPDAWEYDNDGNVRITGTGLTIPARPAGPA